MEDLVHDLVQYHTYLERGKIYNCSLCLHYNFPNVHIYIYIYIYIHVYKLYTLGVRSSARSLVNLLREIFPAILKRKDRGKVNAGDARPAPYGDIGK
jgi:hypothetical protein